jgi:Uma2 family endonuclease
MGESPEQHDIIKLFLQCLEEWSRERGWKNVYLGGDAFFAWVPTEPLVRVSPDVYLLDDAPEPHPASWQTWRPGVKPPRFALEVVSLDRKKDYVDGPERYAALGCKELVIFDPSAVGAKHGDVFTVFRRDMDGAFVQAYAGPGPVFSEELAVTLVQVTVKGRPRVRPARDVQGTDLIASATERADAEAKRATELQARVAALEAELKRRGG